MNVTVRNVITSMRLMSAVDWAEFFESVSLVDAVLRADSDFAEMDFPTRDRYRHAIEEARARLGPHRDRSRATRDCGRQARGAEGPNRDGATVRREQDPGYLPHLERASALEKEIGFRAPLREWLVRANAAAGILGYLGTIAVVSAIILALLLFALVEFGVSGWTRFILAILAVIPAIDAAVALVNRAVTASIGPATLPAWSFTTECRRACARWSWCPLF